MKEGLQRTLALFVALTAVCSGQDGAGIALGITDSGGGLKRCERFRNLEILLLLLFFIRGGARCPRLNLIFRVSLVRLGTCYNLR